jgi:hypothetical protein
MYAIGEIFLVVIGILIALYINNKKAVYDLEEQQKNHLVLIKEELKNNLLILEKEDKTLLKMIINIRYLINLAGSDTSINETDLSGHLFLPTTRAIEVNYENSAFNEFVSSSNLRNIKNDSLRNFLRSWERKLETLKFQESAVNESLDKSTNFIEANGSLKTIFDNTGLSENYFEVKNSSKNRSNKNLLKSIQFESILMQYLGVATQLHKKDYQTVKNDIRKLIHLIEEDLKTD